VRRAAKAVLDAGFVTVVLLDEKRDHLCLPSIAGVPPAALAPSSRALSATSTPDTTPRPAGAPIVNPLKHGEAVACLKRLGGESCDDGYVRIPRANAGVVGMLALASDVVSSGNVATDPRYQAPGVQEQQAAMDKVLGVPSCVRSLLAAPITDGDGRRWGILLVANKRLIPRPPPPKPAVGAAGVGGGAPAAPTATLAGEAGPASHSAAPSAGDATGLGAASVAPSRRRLTLMRTWTFTGDAGDVDSPAGHGALDDDEDDDPAAQAVGAGGAAPGASAGAAATGAPSAAPTGGDGAAAGGASAAPAGGDAPQSSPFSARDEDVAMGVAAAVCMALDDRKVQVGTMFNSGADCLPLNSVVGPFQVAVTSIAYVQPVGTRSASGKEKDKEAAAAAAAGGRDASGGVGKARAAAPSSARRGAPVSVSGKQSGAVTVTASLWHGSSLMCDAKAETAPLYAQTDGLGSAGAWNATVTFAIRCCNLPFATRIIFNVALKDGTPVGWAGCNAFTAQQVLNSGMLHLPLWPGRLNADNVIRITNLFNDHAPDGTVPILSIGLPVFEKPVVRINVPSMSAAASALLTATPPVGAADAAGGWDGGGAVSYVRPRVSAEEFVTMQAR